MRNLLSSIFHSMFYEKEPDNSKFTKGQKVFCMKTNNPLSKVTQGEIVRYAWTAKAFYSFHGICGWYVVKYNSGQQIIIPEDRMCDLQEHITREEKYFKTVNDLGLRGQRGFEDSAYNTLTNQLKDCKKYL